MEIIENLEPLLKTFWYIAIPTSIIFALQTILTFAGGDTSDEIGSDAGHIDTPLQLFTLRNLINFLLGLSWTGISFYNTISNKSLLVFISLLVGLLFVYVFVILIKQVNKLSEDNSFRMVSTINKTAEVYLTIPGQRRGKGKIIISVKGSTHELDAVTEMEDIPSGSAVKVVRIENNNLLIVEKI